MAEVQRNFDEFKVGQHHLWRYLSHESCHHMIKYLHLPIPKVSLGHLLLLLQNIFKVAAIEVVATGTFYSHKHGILYLITWLATVMKDHWPLSLFLRVRVASR